MNEPNGATDSVSSRVAQNVPIADLKSHPLQGSFYETSGSDRIESLAKDIGRNGLHQPIVVAPAGKASGRIKYVIFDGHDRVEAARLLGWRDIPAINRDDLAHADAATTEREYLSYNIARKHLDQLDQARVVLRLYEIERGREPGDLYQGDHAEARDRVGQVIGMSGRNLQRYFNVLAAPIEIQRAFQRGDLSLVDAARIGCMQSDGRAEIAEQIAAAENPADVKEIVRGYFLKQDQRYDDFYTVAAVRLVRHLKRGLATLDGRFDSIDGPTLIRSMPTLLAAQEALPKLIAAAQQPGVSGDELAGVFTDTVSDEELA